MTSAYTIIGPSVGSDRIGSVGGGGGGGQARVEIRIEKRRNDK